MNTLVTLGLTLLVPLERLADRGANVSIASSVILLVAGGLTIAGGGPLVS